MKTAVKATYVAPKLTRVSLMSNAISSMALACCRATVVAPIAPGFN
jgi:hypothetical protein